MNLQEQCQALFAACLQSYCARYYHRPAALDEAMRYALLGNGKRVRPLLLLLSTQALGGDVHAALRPALAIELLHTWSLVHDDLPCMDDDDVRRGQAAVHKKFGAADALLAGDALLSDAFYLLSTETRFSAAENFLPATTRTQLTTLFARAIGSRGMVYGQHRDLHTHHPTPAELCAVQRAKTGWLLAAACGAGAIVATSKHVMRFVRLGLRIGMVFQIIDDIIDAEPQGASWLALMPAAQARARARQQMTCVRRNLQQAQLSNTALAHYIETLAKRSH